MTDPKLQYLDQNGLQLYDLLMKQYISDKVAVFYDTTAHWNSKSALIGKEGCIYIYSDYKKNSQDQDIAGIKVGDGKGYLIDAPFVSELLYDHLEDQIRHITQSEREFWNSKVRCYINPSDNESLMFTTE